MRPGVSAAIVDLRPTFDNVLLRAADGDVRRHRPADRLRAHADGFERARGAASRAWTDSVAIVENIDVSAEVALVNPNAAVRRAAASSAAGARRAASAPRDDHGASRHAPDRSVPALWLPDLGRSLDNLLLHKLRTLLTMLGMIFGVAAVLSMLSIGAGAQQQVMAFIEGLGVRNLIVEARETTESPGVSEDPPAVAGADVPGPARHPGGGARALRRCHAAQAVHADAGGAEAAPASCRWSTASSRTTSSSIAALRLAAAGSSRPTKRRAPARCACSARRRACALFGVADPLGQFVKIGEQWFRVIGIAGPQADGARRRRRRARRRIATT